MTKLDNFTRGYIEAALWSSYNADKPMATIISADRANIL
jgi:hypothetical protein